MSTSTSESTTVLQSNLPSVRRVVTGHTAERKSVVLANTEIEALPFMGKGPSFMSDVFWTDTAPADNGVNWTDTIKDHANELVGPAGSSFRVVDMPPGQVSPFHRTVSLDYGFISHGTLTLILDDDKRVSLKAGDVVIQRGTIHGWHNEGTEWVRMYAIMLPSERVKIGDEELDKAFQPPRK